ncbi:hypothetical protein BDY21DRAFT_383324 [Lineolata rhizophorae]|uniref:Cyclase-domain-containing protein n=1 Tax=Lineolata rhizophorae TaxID=578093 RepID=A0A6A6PF73_9PEZI|nr:hypothetical protein BDY21DRAFT_383324 [Lineolata rhizophorae]
MSDSSNSSSAQSRLTQLKGFLTMNKTATTIPWDPDSTKFPTRKELPSIPGAPKDAAWVWGENDFSGRLNLLTPTRVRAAAKEITYGEIVPVNLPLDVPSTPAFGRRSFEQEIKPVVAPICYDDVYHLNTQSGTQWDGFRHFAHIPTGQFYNRTTAEDLVGPNPNHKCSIHYLAEHGIAGRGVLLDYAAYAAKMGARFDSFDYHEISWDELYQCGKDQGIDIRPAAQGGDIKVGDILFVRSGWVEQYYQKTPEERHRLATRETTHGPDSKLRYAGVSQEEKVLDWLHDCYFAAVSGDGPTFEAWPTQREYYLHEYILALWGMPLGEMLDLEKLAQKCREHNKWFFFFSSTPANCRGGVGSHVNGQAIL